MLDFIPLLELLSIMSDRVEPRELVVVEHLDCSYLGWCEGDNREGSAESGDLLYARQILQLKIGDQVTSSCKDQNKK
jgi:hypothetical protein